MLELAASHGDRFAPASEVAANQGISVKYLESLLSSLKTGGLVISERGKRGGYSLARPPSEISMFDVLSCLEDSLDFVYCTVDPRGCERLELCVTRQVWIELKQATDRILKRTYLDDLLKRQSDLAAQGAPFAREIGGVDL
jgi:Rrf2 family protein